MPEANPELPEDFESALSRLEDIVKTLEDGDLALDEALGVFEEGIRLSRFCHGKLEQAERRVELLLKDADGSVRTVPFDPPVGPSHESQ
jgi:exodeoxyribonuclease VII small subunit